MGVSIDQMFSGMDNAPMFGAGVYFSPGTFLLKAKSFKVNDGFKGRAFIAEFDVVESTNQKDKPGDVRSWVVMLASDKNKNAFSDIKALIFSIALGIDPKKAGQPTDPGHLVIAGLFAQFPIEQRTKTYAEAHALATALVKAACDADYAKQIGLQPGQLEGQPVRLMTWEKPTRPTAQKPQGGVFTVHAWSPATAEGVTT